MKKEIKIAPSILSADFANLLKDVKETEAGGADLLHIDVMDGHFVPNITIGPLVLGAISDKIKLPMDVHLMISDPEKYASKFIKNGAKIVTFHIEAIKNPQSIVKLIKSQGVSCGISIKPGTSFDTVKDIMDHINLLLIMTVEPGFGGQKFMEDMLPKIEEARTFIEDNKLDVDIEVDGGIDTDTAVKVVNAGANVLVAGSSIYGSTNIANAISNLRKAVSS